MLVCEDIARAREIGRSTILGVVRFTFMAPDKTKVIIGDLRVLPEAASCFGL